MTENGRLVRRRRGARRRSKLKLLLRLLVSCAFLAAAAMLSAGIVKVVERPVAPWQVEEKAPAVSEAAPASIGDGGALAREQVEEIALAAPVDPEQGQALLQQRPLEDQSEATALR